MAHGGCKVQVDCGVEDRPGVERPFGDAAAEAGGVGAQHRQ